MPICPICVLLVDDVKAHQAKPKTLDGPMRYLKDGVWVDYEPSEPDANRDATIDRRANIRRKR